MLVISSAFIYSDLIKLKIRSTFHTEKTLHKLLWKPKDPVATGDKNNIVYEIDCSICQTVYFGEFKRSLKWHSDEHKRSISNCNCDNPHIKANRY